ncbi:MAG: hypothetical protein PHU04_02335 [Candidatus Peribacteraceae bacterium]|nr:hypothetical protein [Candidatus Peribacteraceae bacterium]
MDLRTLPDGLSPSDRCNVRRQRMEEELHVDLKHTALTAEQIGHADEKNCEQMFGAVPVPVGYAGPLRVTFSSGEKADLHLPLATTEGALVASVNRGCKALSQTGGVTLTSVHHGTSRSIAFRILEGSPGEAPGTGAKSGVQSFIAFLSQKESEWSDIGIATSTHLQLLSHTIESEGNHVFLTIYCDTDEAMGMNMVTIAAQAIGVWVSENYKDVAFITVAGNVDSDKKPSKRTHDQGRGYEGTAEAVLSGEVIETVLKSSLETMLEVAHAKLEIGSNVAGALGKNLHAANIVAALFLATGQDAAHVVEGSLADTTVKQCEGGLRISVRLPALMVGVRGGGTSLPAQQQCLGLLLSPKTSLRPCTQLAQSIAAGVLAGEVSLLAAQASHTLAKAHRELGR